jgi:hypothetical protein
MVGVDRAGVSRCVHRSGVVVAMLGLSLGCAADRGPPQITIKTYPGGVPIPGDPSSNATLVAFQDGDQPWRTLDGTGGIYHAVVTSERYGVAVGCGGDGVDPSGITVVQHTVADATELALTGCAVAPTSTGTVTLSGTMHGIPAGQTASITAATRRQAITATVNADGSYRLTVPAGQRRQVFARTFGADTTGQTRFYVGPTLELTAADTLDIDIAADGRPIQNAALATQGVNAGDNVVVIGQALTHLAAFQIELQSLGQAVPTSYEAIDPGQLAPGDLVAVSVQTSATTGVGNTGQHRQFFAYTTPGKPLSVALPAPLIVPVPRISQANSPLLTVSVPSDLVAGVSDGASLIASISSTTQTPLGSVLRYFSATLSRDYLASSGALTYTAPDLSALAGWQPAMVLVPGQAGIWLIGSQESKVSSTQHRSDGDVLTLTGSLGSLTL